MHCYTRNLIFKYYGWDCVRILSIVLSLVHLDWCSSERQSTAQSVWAR